jgi:hypothetical protein
LRAYAQAPGPPRSPAAPGPRTGVVVEIAVIDAATGQVLLDTLVNPDGVRVDDGARAVHGISDEELAGAPRWGDVAPDFLAAVSGRRILAYNAFTSQAGCREWICISGQGLSRRLPVQSALGPYRGPLTGAPHRL